MRTNIFTRAKRMVAVLICGSMFTAAMSQEALHLFYKDGSREAIEITSDTKVEFYKRPYLNAYYEGTDTIHMPASAGRCPGIGFVEANKDWTVSTDTDWLLARNGEQTAVSVEGYGITRNYFVIYATPYEGDKVRYGKVVVASDDKKLSKEFTVVQHPYMLSFGSYNFDNAVIADNDEINWNDTIFSCAIYPNHSVKVVSYPSWMKLKDVYGADDDYKFENIINVEIPQFAATSPATGVSFEVEQNNDPKDRKGNIIFEGMGQTAVLTVTQKGLSEATIVAEASMLLKELYKFNIAGMAQHNDFGFPTVMFAMDSRGTDMVSEYTGYNWFGSALDYRDLLPDYSHTFLYWRSMYNAIEASNRVIDSYKERSGESIFKFILAQAYALRAFNYFYLAQMYQQTYIGNESALCVPIVTEENMNTLYSEGCARATVAEVYDFVLKDLDEAFYMLEETTVANVDKQFITQPVICGLRARICMVMNRWQRARDEALRAIDMSDATPYSISDVSKPGFSDIDDISWMWGIDTDETDSPVTSGICNFPSHMGSLNYGYASVGAWRCISKRLFDAIPETDVRKGWWLDADGFSPNLDGEQAAYAAELGCYPYTQMKFGCYQDVIYQSTNANDIPLMRVEEMYLIVAEACAMMGDVAAAVNILNKFVVNYRDPAFYCYANNVEEVRDAIWMQRRIELWGEGHSYFDLMRMDKGVDRRGAGFEAPYVFYIPPHDAALILPIPEIELTRNVQLVQNPISPLPTPVGE